MVDELFHDIKVVNAYIVKFGMFTALKNSSGDIGGEDFIENAVAHIRVTEGVCHKESTVKLAVIYQIIYAAFADIKGIAADHSCESRNVGDIHIVLVSEVVDASENVELVFFFES